MRKLSPDLPSARLKERPRGQERRHSTSYSLRNAIVCTVTVVTLIGLLIGGAASASGSKPEAKTPLSRGLAFYRGATIAAIVPGTPGDGFDLYTRALTVYMAEYLHATINVEDIDTGAGTGGSDALAAAIPNGLTFGILNILNLASTILTNTETINFNPARLEYVAALGPTPYVLISNPTSPYTSFAALKNSATPAKTLVSIPGTAYTLLSVLFGVLGVHVQYVSGYSSTSALTTGYLRGDGPVTFTAVTSLGPLIASGQARALAINFKPPADFEYRSSLLGVPTFAALLKKYPPKTKKEVAQAGVLSNLGIMGDPFVTQTAVPGYKLDALRAAAAWAFKQPGFQTAILNAGATPKYLNPVQAKNQFLDILKEGSLVSPYIAAG